MRVSLKGGRRIIALALLLGTPGSASTPRTVDTFEHRIRVVPVHGLARPWALAFLPDGDILITERAGRLRIVRKGVLDPQAIFPENVKDVIADGFTTADKICTSEALKKACEENGITG